MTRDLKSRAELREQLVRQALVNTVERIALRYLQQYKHLLEPLEPGDPVPDEVPVGKKERGTTPSFVDWVKNEVQEFYPTYHGHLERPESLHLLAKDVADAIAKSPTRVLNPMKDYEPSKETVMVRKEAYVKKFAKEPQKSPAEPKNHNLYTAPVEHTRYCPEHTGSMLRRVSDNVYQCPIEGSLYQTNPWKDQYSYAGGHEVKFETGVQNQTSGAWNLTHPLPSFLDGPEEKSAAREYKGKSYDFEKLYDVFDGREDLIDPKSPNDDGQKEKEIQAMLKKITKMASDKDLSYCPHCDAETDTHYRGFKKPEFGPEVAHGPLCEECNKDKTDYSDESEICPKCGMTDCPCMAEGKECTCKSADVDSTPVSAVSRITSKKAQTLFAPTTMPTRQCPDHPGQQLARVEDNVRQCPLDEKVYNFTTGFETYDGQKHNGGTVQNQGAIPPGSTIIKLQGSTGKKRIQAFKGSVADSPTVHQFLYKVLQQLPAGEAREILNIKFGKGISLEQAIASYNEAQEMVRQQQQQNQANKQ